MGFRFYGDRIEDDAGFQIQFPNKVVVSIMGGYSNYCSRRRMLMPKDALHTVEVAVWLDNETSDYLTGRNDYITNEICKPLGIHNDGSVAGWVTAEDVAKIIAAAAAYQPTTT